MREMLDSMEHSTSLCDLRFNAYPVFYSSKNDLEPDPRTKAEYEDDEDDEVDEEASSDEIGREPRPINDRKNFGRSWANLALVDEYPRSKHTATTKTRKLSVAKSYVIPGLFEGARVSACWDTGSDLNIIREDFARRHGLGIDMSKRKSFRLPDKRTAKSIGQTKAIFQFQGEHQEHHIVFDVVPRCPENVILGLGFLKQTGTLLRENAHRIRESDRLCMQEGNRLFFIDDHQGAEETHKHTLPFMLNGHRGQALPDSGSDLMAISGAYARRCGFNIDKSFRIPALLADGHKVLTDGIVRDAALGFAPATLAAGGWDSDDYAHYVKSLRDVSLFHGSADQRSTNLTVICDLHVIEDLPFDLILSTQFIMDNRALLPFHESEASPKEDVSDRQKDVFAVRIKRKWTLAKIFGRQQDNPTASTDECQSEQDMSDELRLKKKQEDEERLIQWETVLRAQKNQYIASRPKPEQEALRREETQRREKWERTMIPTASSGATTNTPSVMLWGGPSTNAGQGSSSSDDPHTHDHGNSTLKAGPIRS